MIDVYNVKLVSCFFYLIYLEHFPFLLCSLCLELEFWIFLVTLLFIFTILFYSEYFYAQFLKEQVGEFLRDFQR